MKVLFLLFSFVVTSVSSAACLPNTICVGHRVMDSSNRLALVVGVNDKGVAQVKLDDRIFPVSRFSSTLSKKVECYQNICANDRVLDAADQTGIVTEVFDNGKAQVRFDDGTADIRVAVTLGKSEECIDKVCIDHNFKDLAGNTGIILELYDSGKAIVKFDHTAFPRIRTFVSLNLDASCKIKENCRPGSGAPQSSKKPTQKKPKPIDLRGGRGGR